MRTVYLLFLIVVFAGCGSSDEGSPHLPEVGLIRDNKINIGNDERNYVLYIPDNQQNSPIVLLLHGNSDNAEALLGIGDSDRVTPYRRWVKLADENNLILAVPDGGINAADVQGWNDCRGDGSGNPEIDDVDFIHAMIEEVKAIYSVDASRQYVNGTSNGGHLAIRLAQEAPLQFTAIASVIAAMPAVSECPNADVPISVLLMNGTEDSILPYEGGEMAFNRGSVLSTEASINYWITRNQTDTEAAYKLFDDINVADGSTVEKFLYKNGVNNTEVALYRVNNGGHTEPSIQERYRGLFTLVVGTQNGDIEMANEIWEFFKDKSR